VSSLPVRIRRRIEHNEPTPGRRDASTTTPESFADSSYTRLVPAGSPATPLVAKLGIKGGNHVVVLGAPTNWVASRLPHEHVVRRRSSRKADVLIVFFSQLASLRRQIQDLSESIAPDGALWVVWPRRAGGHESDLTDNEIRALALPLGIVDVKVAALDDDWSGLKFMWRLEGRAARR
jgi:hypothetical protein